MKLLMISGDRALARGEKGAFYYTLEEFHKYWDRIDIVCPASAAISHRSSAIGLFGNVFIHPSSWPLWLQPWWIRKKGREIFKEHKPNLIVVHEYPPFYNGLGAYWLHRKTGLPYVIEIHHVPGYPKAADFKEKFYRFIFKKFISADAKNAKAVRTVNQNQVPNLLIQSGVKRSEIVFIPSLYINFDIFFKKESEKKFDVVCAARLEKNKNIAGLISAISLVRRDLPNVRMLIIGQGPEEDKLKTLVKSRELGQNVQFAGWLPSHEEVAVRYSESKIFVNPSFNEGGPRTVIEAMACGVPVITTRVGIMPELIKDGESGFFTDWKPEAMAEKILFLLNNRELQQKFSDAGYRLVQQFEKKAAVANYAGKLKELIK